MEAIISDIHANFEALKAVYEDIDEHFSGAEIICLGDAVGYNASPNRVINFMREHKINSVIGNHDAAVLGEIEAEDFNDQARSGVAYAREELTEENLEWLASRPWEICTDRVKYVHGCPISGDNDDKKIAQALTYIFDRMTAAAAISDMDHEIAVVGHTHVPTFWTLGEQPPGSSEWRSIEQKKIILNPGSVGQPRGEDNRSSYAVLDLEEDRYQHRRVEYDRQRCKKRILEAGYCRSRSIAERL